jgi:hypothetical protein
MRNLLGVLASLLSAAASAQQQPAPTDAPKEARQFLLRYSSLSSTSNVAVLDLYRDDARIRASSFTGNVETPAGITRGDAWKRQLRAGWYDGTSRLEASSFQAASVARDGERLVIRARRYSQTGCYWDNGYAVVVVPDRIGQYQILEERISFQRSSVCPSSAPQQRLATAPAGAAAGAQTPATLAAPRPPGLPSNVIPIGQGGLRPNTQARPTPGAIVQP